MHRLHIVVVEIPIEHGFASLLDSVEHSLLYRVDHVEAHKHILVKREG